MTLRVPSWWIAVPMAAVACVMLVAACSGSPGRLTADRRVSIVEPQPGSTVTNPVVLRWSSTFTAGAASGRWFAVYLDAAAAAPGASVLAAAGTTCETVPACVALGALSGPNVFVTDALSVAAGSLPGGAGPEHRFTIVLVDERGIRDGAVAWTASFRIEQD